MDVVVKGLVDVWFENSFVLMQYTHLCVTVAERMELYMNGKLKMKVGSPADLAVMRTTEGSLVLGQDQDKPEGGYSKDFTFSGTITDFHIFARVVSPEEVVAMAQCRVPPSDALVTQANGWVLNNVQVSDIKRQHLCSEGTGIFLFTMQVIPEHVSELCHRLKGYMPVVDDAATVIIGLEKYLKVQSSFIKVYIPLNDTRYNSYDQFMTMKIIYDNGYYCKPLLSPTRGNVSHQSMACSIESGNTLKLLGLSDKMKHEVDSKYYFHFEEGKHFLRGIENSFIRRHDKKKSWCLAQRQSPANSLLCTDTPFDFPPVGRRYWAGPDNETLRLTLSGCREDEFTCDSGRCVKLSGRCDSRMNCDDRSDEDNCDVIRVDTEQRMSVTSKPFSPLEVKAEVNLAHLTGINLAENNFVASMWLHLSWTDKRLEFFNLPSSSSKAAKLSTENMWKPKVFIYPVKTTGQPRMTGAEVWRTCEGEASHYNVWEGMPGSHGGEGARLVHAPFSTILPSFFSPRHSLKLPPSFLQSLASREL